MTRSKKPRDGSSRESDPAHPGDPSHGNPASASPSDAGGEPVTVGQWKERGTVVRRAFPGPRVVHEPLRVAMERGAYADVVAHAKESLDAEICGVLVGSPCRDDDGDFTHVEAAVQGTHASEGSTHVTFTQETWNAIHESIRRDHPKLQIVGWYHSHPGFGVEFSEMDIFIQQNFFAGSAQIGLLTDPLSGDVATCINAPEGIRYLSKFWVDGRPHDCRVPAEAASGTGGASASRDTVAALETRINQLIHAVDDMRQTVYRWIYLLGILLGMAIVFFITHQIASMIFGDLPEPPSRISFAAVPVNIGGKACLLGVNVVSWQIPPELVYVPESEEAAEKETDDAKRQSGKEPPSKAQPAKGSPPPVGTGADTSAAKAKPVLPGKPPADVTNKGT